MSGERHPVADLLTDEMRERVQVAKFSRKFFGIRDENGDCPFGVAIGQRGLTLSIDVCRAIGVSLDSPERQIIRNFMELMDYGSLGADPADVYVMLGAEPPAPCGTIETAPGVS